MSNYALIVPANFIQATRDSGYKSLGSALAELVDNAFEAKARHVTINIEKCTDKDIPEVHLCVSDDGVGMDSHTLRHALQFGWSSRFNQRDSHGRYGMGLPNASLSHARRVEVLTSPDGKKASGTYLDVDEIVRGQAEAIPQPHRVSWPEFAETSCFARGTVVTWHKCDRLLDRKLGPLARKLRSELGRLFRYQLWSKKTITVNGDAVIPFDPLFVAKNGTNLVGAKLFGSDLVYEIAIPNAGGKKCSTVTVRFTELPISDWHSLSNEEKNVRGIAKNAGVSVVRAGREIDRGWFFMGNKRKENYDDWWRCEVCFRPDLDELFGVTHTKQEVHPTDQLLSILEPDIERIARELNGRARRAFINVKAETCRRKSETQAEKYDSLIEPPHRNGAEHKPSPKPLSSRGRGRVAGLEYRLRFGRLDDELLYHPEIEGSRLTVVLNEAHPFVKQVWPSGTHRLRESTEDQRCMELLILAAARSEITLATKDRNRREFAIFRRSWSSILTTFLS
jgi:hypothetical protein